MNDRGAWGLFQQNFRQSPRLVTNEAPRALPP
ncbi:hypothetical protein PYK22_00363 [Pyrinomonas methylaliphatogenes]|uniref:Uncharacterized protein n=1 Tax=Pyrinomonas methylaliphatogenes TaxID=454194 RepID=A0A0B6WW35_9BACT|nr:hypothetical protein PYK22_00363 [Pyrinomonas methylaliphatogenes]